MSNLMRKPTYAELLQDPRWQKRRLEIFNRANFACEFCGATDKTLHAHHLIYIKGAKPWEYDEAQLACLCADCHELWHLLKASLNDAVATMKLGALAQLVGYATGLQRGREAGLSSGVTTIGASIEKGRADAFNGMKREEAGGDSDD